MLAKLQVVLKTVQKTMVRIGAAVLTDVLEQDLTSAVNIPVTEAEARLFVTRRVMDALEPQRTPRKRR